MKVWITRPIEDAGRVGRALEAAGHQAVIAPLLVFKPLPIFQPDWRSYAALIVTSRNGLRGLQQNIVNWPNSNRALMFSLPLVAVGPATAQMASEIGFETIFIGANKAASLPPLIRISFKG